MVVSGAHENWNLNGPTQLIVMEIIEPAEKKELTWIRTELNYLIGLFK